MQQLPHNDTESKYLQMEVGWRSPGSVKENRRLDIFLPIWDPIRDGSKVSIEKTNSCSVVYPSATRGISGILIN